MSVPQVGGTLTFFLDRRLLDRSLVLRGDLSPPHMVFVLSILQIPPLAVAVSHCLENREMWLRRCRRALDLHHSI